MTQKEERRRVSLRLLVILLVLGVPIAFVIGLLMAGLWGAGESGASGRERAGVQTTQSVGHEAAGKRKILYWRAPMDPNYISDKPGKSPMGMDLIPVYAGEEGVSSGLAIRIDPVTIQNMGIRTTILKRGPLVKTIRTVGRVDYDEQRVAFITTKVKGWIEKLYVNETGQFVRKGEKTFDVYSPELYSAQEEYLAALRGLEAIPTGSEAARQQTQQLVDAAATKLKFLDVSQDQIDELRRTRKIKKNVTMHSPTEGIVTDKMALEGMYITPDMKLYTIADLSRIWVYVDIYEYQLPWIRLGQVAHMTLPYIPGKEYTGRIVYIYPYLNEQTRIIRIRLEFENPSLELKPEMYANVRLLADLHREGLLIPRDAYINSGTRNVAFVYLGEGRFDPRHIEVGVEAENEMVEVLSGLHAGDVVVTSGQFLLDSESKLEEAVAQMRQPKPLGGEEEVPMKGMKHIQPSMPAGPATQPTSLPAAVETPLDEITEHYLVLTQLLASDDNTGTAAQARQIADASDALSGHLASLTAADRRALEQILHRLREAALEIKGQGLEGDRARFAQLSDAMVTLVKRLRPDRQRWPKLYIFHCPMSHGDWIQTSEQTANPYYGFKMLKCGEVIATE